MEAGSFRLCQQEAPGEVKADQWEIHMHKLRGIKLLLNERMYIKVALVCYRLINLGRYPA